MKASTSDRLVVLKVINNQLVGHSFFFSLFPFFTTVLQQFQILCYFTQKAVFQFYVILLGRLYSNFMLFHSESYTLIICKVRLRLCTRSNATTISPLTLVGFVIPAERPAFHAELGGFNYTVLHIFRQVLFWARNQSNHQNFEPSLLYYKYRLVVASDI